MIYDVIVIGGGQAGLAAGYYLKQKKKNFLILDERQKTGDSWYHRYDSLVLFTPKSYSSLPGLDLTGNLQEYPTKNEIAQYLHNYAVHFALPILHNLKVKQLSKDKEDKGFIIQTQIGETYRANQVIVATGGFHNPYTPPITDAISNDVFQIHAVDYRRPSQIPSGKVLVVGAGNTGVQIASELIETHHVILSSGKKIKALPQTILGNDLFWWLDRFGVLDVKITSKLGQWIKQRDPIIGGDIQKVRKKASIRGRLKSVNQRTAQFENGTEAEVQSIIWATGYRNHYSWITINGVLDRNGQPIHQRGITNAQGLFFVGLSWQYKRGSALIYGVGEDARFVVDSIGK
ncbi:oxidoreductase [Paenibacillus montaniterrae]|uniref:Oxidoreductase n=1 Tax=Paenibacillus montaniterrae TaxID=429341 RepID=A0A919YHZ7_9BACL|nr:NAD(P)/FAD-dependent oxidoreductase [Paenibacillus montaniterrae]GIP14717.1 oxidoreductase [Paenibacillus montaniterrae]